MLQSIGLGEIMMEFFVKKAKSTSVPQQVPFSQSQTATWCVPLTKLETVHLSDMDADVDADKTRATDSFNILDCPNFLCKFKSLSSP